MCINNEILGNYALDICYDALECYFLHYLNTGVGTLSITALINNSNNNINNSNNSN